MPSRLAIGRVAMMMSRGLDLKSHCCRVVAVLTTPGHPLILVAASSNEMNMQGFSPALRMGYMPRKATDAINAELADEIKAAMEAMLQATGLERAYVALLRLRLFEAIEVLAGDSEIRKVVLACQLRRERKRLESW